MCLNLFEFKSAPIANPDHICTYHKYVSKRQVLDPQVYTWQWEGRFSLLSTWTNISSCLTLDAIVGYGRPLGGLGNTGRHAQPWYVHSFARLLFAGWLITSSRGTRSIVLGGPSNSRQWDTIHMGVRRRLARRSKPWLTVHTPTRKSHRSFIKWLFVFIRYYGLATQTSVDLMWSCLLDWLSWRSLLLAATLQFPLPLHKCRMWYAAQFVLLQAMLSAVELVLVIRGLSHLSHVLEWVANGLYSIRSIQSQQEGRNLDDLLPCYGSGSDVCHSVA